MPITRFIDPREVLALAAALQYPSVTEGSLVLSDARAWAARIWSMTALEKRAVLEKLRRIQERRDGSDAAYR